MYTGKTKNLGIIGYPVEHSLSPAMQLAAIKKAGLDYAYIAMPVAPENLAAAIFGLKALQFRGFNVTIPHKISIMQYLDTIDENAAMIGAVNTVCIENGQLHGYNTDAAGFMRALTDRGFQCCGKTAVLYGAGGAARAVIWGLITAKIQHICIGVRNVEKAASLVSIFAKYLKVEVFHWDDPLFKHSVTTADLLVNCTPLGMSPQIDQMIPLDCTTLSPYTIVYDLIYTPPLTKLLLAAQANGNPIINGADMLVGQGAAAFRIWTGSEADTTVMKAPLL